MSTKKIVVVVPTVLFVRQQCERWLVGLLGNWLVGWLAGCLMRSKRE